MDKIRKTADPKARHELMQEHMQSMQGAHYLVNIAPILGATGLVTFATQYQLEFFWIGLAFNLAGIAFIGNRLWKAAKEHALCVHA